MNENMSENIREKMRAVVIKQYGNNDVVNCIVIDRPEVGDDEVLVKVHAAGVNPVDWKIRDGAGERMGMTFPIHLGSELSGTIVKLGHGVTSLKQGDAVYGIVKSGAFADYAVVKAADMVIKPAQLDFIHAAAVPLASLTAWQAMFDLAKLASGQRLLITGGSGGVGSMAIQLAKAAGAHVTAMASGRNEEFIRSLGADAFIDYTAQPFEQVVRDMTQDMDVVFDTVGGDTFKRALSTLKKGGFLVTSVAFPKDEGLQHGVDVARVQCKPDSGQLESISQLLEAGKLKTHIETVLPLSKIKEAFELSRSGRTRGKIVLSLDV
ncbi:NADP-dependent oxidoreductase [Undibacterium sp. TJN19]|uniref:NADP-dependent oxidoreductase n=1 Tax=Undibacterium sp. TJN19 TaxID=3413055 RepID=UPI003BF3A066